MPKRLQLVNRPGGYRGTKPGTEKPWADGDVRPVADVTAEYLLESFPHNFVVCGEPIAPPTTNAMMGDRPDPRVAALLGMSARDLRKRVQGGDYDALLGPWLAQEQRSTVRGYIEARQRAIPREG